MIPQRDDYDFSGDCEPDCSCYRTECPELFCGVCNKLLPLDFLKQQFPLFTNYCACVKLADVFPDGLTIYGNGEVRGGKQ